MRRQQKFSARGRKVHQVRTFDIAPQRKVRDEIKVADGDDMTTISTPSKTRFSLSRSRELDVSVAPASVADLIYEL